MQLSDVPRVPDTRIGRRTCVELQLVSHVLEDSSTR